MLNNERVRGIVWQALLIAAVGGIGWYLFTNTLHNLSTRQIQVGFDFLGREAGFEIAEKRIEFDPSMSYARAFAVGILNTLHVAAIGIVIATVIGTLVGISRLSSNWLLARLASAYVEVMRNVPLLLGGRVRGDLPNERGMVGKWLDMESDDEEPSRQKHGMGK
jgi:general L-amino acid transport system permease protein